MRPWALGTIVAHMQRPLPATLKVGTGVSACCAYWL